MTEGFGKIRAFFFLENEMHPYQELGHLLREYSSACVTCAELFEPSRAWQKYCSPKCRHNAPDKKVRTQEFQQSRRDIINRIKMDRGCARCGYNIHAAALDFNHIQGSKNFSISQDPKVALKKLLDEIAKCEILCANCHRVHTYENRHWHTKRKAAQNG